MGAESSSNVQSTVEAKGASNNYADPIGWKYLIIRAVNYAGTLVFAWEYARFPECVSRGLCTNLSGICHVLSVCGTSAVHMADMADDFYWWLITANLRCYPKVPPPSLACHQFQATIGILSHSEGPLTWLRFYLFLSVQHFKVDSCKSIKRLYRWVWFLRPIALDASTRRHVIILWLLDRAWQFCRCCGWVVGTGHRNRGSKIRRSQ
jgi:hypothetical protein